MSFQEIFLKAVDGLTLRQSDTPLQEWACTEEHLDVTF